MFRYTFIFLLFIYSFGYSQGEVLYSVIFSANGELISENNNHVLYNSDTIIITKLKLYISNIRLLKKGEEVWKDVEKAHLIDLKNNIGFDLNKSSEIVYDEIRFDIGIDSLTNVSGALSGALDPTKGMYWSWQSGYINFKLEGYKKNNNIKSNLLKYHIGGYMAPFNPIQSFSFKTGSKQIDITFDIKFFLSELDLENQKNIMRPCKESVELANLISKAIYIND